MAKKTSLPDFTSAFTSALSADLKEAAAKMRRMSQPPKHSEPQNASPDVPGTPAAPFQGNVTPASPARDASAGGDVVAKTYLAPSAHSGAADTLSVTEWSPHTEEDPVSGGAVTPEAAPAFATPERQPAASLTPPSSAPTPEGTHSEVSPLLHSGKATDLCAPLTGNDTTVTVDDSHLQSSAVSDGHQLPPASFGSDTSVTVNDCSLTVTDCHTQKSAPDTAPQHTKNTSADEPCAAASHECHQLSPAVNDNCLHLEKPSPTDDDSVAFPTHSDTALDRKKDCHELSLTVIAKSTEEKIAVIPSSSQTVSPDQPKASAIATATIQNAQLGGARQVLLAALLELRKQAPQIIVNLKRLAPVLGLSYGTVRNTVSRLVREGILCTTQIRTGETHGVCIEFLDDTSLLSSTVIQQPSLTVIDSHQQSLMVTDSHSLSSTVTHNDTSIWDTDASLIQTLWPHVAAAGFGPAQLGQLRRAYQIQGWEAHNVARCLRYLDWELARTPTEAVTHVTLWLRSMQQQGHYPRPEGYVDPEVLRLRQQAEEDAALAEAKRG